MTCFAPATVSNLGPGFDVLGLAVEGPGDTVTARLGPALTLVAPEGVPSDPTRNTAGIAAAEVLRRTGARGVELTLRKGMAVGTGLGSSAASAVAAAMATNRLLGDPLSLEELVACAIEGEALVSGRHADNVAPCLYGGLVLVRHDLSVLRLPLPYMTVVTVTPDFELPTRMARQALPESVPLSALVRNASDIGSLVHACHTGDVELFGRAVHDEVVAPVRAALIPGGPAALAAAERAGAFAASVSGAGPTLFALCEGAPSERSAAIAAAMTAIFAEAGLMATARVCALPQPGARLL